MIIQCVECLIKVRYPKPSVKEAKLTGCCSVCFKHAMNRLKVEGNDQEAIKLAKLYEPDESKWGELYNE